MIITLFFKSTNYFIPREFVLYEYVKLFVGVYNYYSSHLTLGL